MTLVGVNSSISTLSDLLQARASALAAKPCLRVLTDGETLGSGSDLSYADLDLQARTLAVRLSAVARSGDRAVLVLPPNGDFLVAFFGCIYAGVIAVPVAPPLDSTTATRLSGVIHDAGPVCLLTVAPLERLLRSTGQVLPEIIDVSDTLGNDLSDWREPDSEPDQIAMLQYTSGSTRRPRGVMVTHANLLSNLEWLTTGMRLPEEPTIVSWLPMYHDMGLIGSLFQTLYTGGNCIVMSPLDFLAKPLRWLKAIAEHHAFGSGSPPFGYELCTRKVTPGELEELDLRHWEVACVTAEPIRMAGLRRFAEVFAPCGFRPEAFYPCFGLAETTLMVTGTVARTQPIELRVDPAELKRGFAHPVTASDVDVVSLVSCGSERPGERVAIVDPDTGAELADQRVGEIWVNGPNVARGYWGREAETEGVFRAFTQQGGGPFLRTGDLGFLDGGQLFVTGRLKDLIIVRGQNIYPQDIEWAAHDSDRRLRPGCGAAFTIGNPDDPTIVLVNEVSAVQSADLDEIATAVRAGFAERCGQAVQLILIPPRAIPKTSSGKVQRSRCRDMFLAEQLPVIWPAVPAETATPSHPTDTTPAVDAWADELRELIAHAVGATPTEVSVDTPVNRLGVNSVRAVEITDALAARRGIDVPLREFLGGLSMRELAHRLAGGSGPGDDVDTDARDGDPDDGGTFELTDLQQAYVAGRNELFELGGVGAHVYAEVDSAGLDLGRLEAAWRVLIDQHDALRTTVSARGFQYIDASSPTWSLPITDLRGHPQDLAESILRAAREDLSHQVFPLDRWPMFELRVHRLDGDRQRIHLSADLLTFDAASLLELVDQWRRLYQDPTAEIHADHGYRQRIEKVSATKQSHRYHRALFYWRERAPLLPNAPRLPRSVTRELAAPRYTRFSGGLRERDWTSFCARATQFGLTPSVALLAAYCEVLATWSEEPRFTVNVTMQHEANAATHRAIGPSADFMLTGVDWSARSSFLARAEDLRQQVLTDLDHRELGGVGILREFARANGYVATAAKAPVVFTPVLRDLGVFDWLGAPAAGASQTPQVALDNQSFLRGGALAFQWDVVEQLFAPGVIVDMFAAYQRLLEKLATDEAAWTNTAALQLVPVEQLRMRAQINDTATPILAMRLEELFTQQCRRDPDRVALVHGGTAWTYAELNAKAAALASWLQSENVQPDELIAIVAEKGCEQTVAVLATLMAGAAYVPLPADLPAARLSSLIADARVRIVLTQARLFDRTTWPDQIRVVAIDALDLARMPQTVSPPKRRLDDRCVVLYTSGSTGPPKGVQLQHHGLVNAITHTIKTFGIGADDRSLAVTDLHHDMSVFDIFGVLAVGGALVTVPHQLRRDPAAWLELVADQRVSIWNSVPASVQMLLDRAEATDTVVPPSLRLILLGGDWIPVDLPGRIRARGSEAEIVSVGGPTETSLWNIAHRVDVTHLDGTSIPYGRPIANTRYYVLDDALNERPDWVTGELCSSGIGTSPGYLNDPELSAEKFVRHPRTGETICRTGDYGRWNPDGYIEFIGRRDGQVQIDGRRVELREIETVLAQHRDIQSCVVTAHPHAHGRRRLVAHVVATEGGGDSNVLAAYLSQQLPEHMRPGVFRFLDAIPTTRNGKQDRQALEADAERADRPSAPPTAAPREGSIAAIVAEVLGVDEIPAHATLSELGVGSLQMVRIAAAIEDTLGLRPDIEQLFTAASIEELGATLTERAGPSSDHGETGGRSGVHSASQPLAAYDIIADPEARQRFREQRRGLRQDYPADPQAVSFPLTRQADADGERSSCREFIGDAVNQSELGQLLSALRDLDTTGHHRRHRYGSGGGTYSVQIYLHIKPGRVEDLTAGCYYYDPSRHSLISLSSESDRFTDELHWWWNRALFRDCAFSLFLVAQLDAIGPLYGQQSMHFATLEAGLITQLLETTAISTGIGLCQIGQLEFAEVRQHFLLSDSHVLLHSLVGGVRAPHVGEPASVESDPTRAAEGLDDALARPGSCVNVETLAAKATLDQAIRRDPAATAIAPQPQWQLLTGATGFLGGFILRELLARGQEVVCLVRAPDEKTARMRLQRNADRLGIDWSTGRDAITALPGDIALPRLGLSERQFDELAGAVTGIYHCAAPVNWVKAYTSLQDGIVGALREILGLAVRRRTKVLHYVSSMAVFPFDGLSSSEDHTLDHKRPLLGGYAQAKWVAERITVEAARRGLPIATYRPPLIAGHSRTGVFNADSYFERMIKGCVELGQAPSLDGVIDVSPVDYVANALVTLSEQSDSVGQTFHLNNPHPIAFVDFVEWMVRRGYAVRPVPFTQWQHDLTAGPHSRSSALTPLEPHLRHASWATMTTAAHDCTRTVGALSAVSDLRCPPVGDDLLNVYFSAFETSGYLTPRSQVWRSRR